MAPILTPAMPAMLAVLLLLLMVLHLMLDHIRADSAGDGARETAEKTSADLVREEAA